MGAILVAERDTGYNGRLGACSGCKQPRKWLNSAGLCKACEQKAQRDKRQKGKRLVAGKVGECGHPVYGRKRLCDRCAEKRYKANNHRQVAKRRARAKEVR